ncbi:hypothetical protein DERP_010605 [Dermatophagoides pteronyssinus]|uniref:Uncharacterized protein n=1 Tax=Dermatophagoides pteronyssinus TaxID=6956 RepID=A0ABQ8J9Y5_DERPT|nr:hypothetical protein DERP_010605 [Dermatophagoides pteronyssinus]
MVKCFESNIDCTICLVNCGSTLNISVLLFCLPLLSSPVSSITIILFNFEYDGGDKFFIEKPLSEVFRIRYTLEFVATTTAEEKEMFRNENKKNQCVTDSIVATLAKISMSIQFNSVDGGE